MNRKIVDGLLKRFKQITVDIIGCRIVTLSSATTVSLMSKRLRNLEKAFVKGSSKIHFRKFGSSIGLKMKDCKQKRRNFARFCPGRERGQKPKPYCKCQMQFLLGMRKGCVYEHLSTPKATDNTTQVAQTKRCQHCSICNSDGWTCLFDRGYQ